MASLISDELKIGCIDDAIGTVNKEIRMTLTGLDGENALACPLTLGIVLVQK